MSKFIIQGGSKLKGDIQASGFKNAATPIIAATILCKEEIVLHNVPVIEDVKKMLQILTSMGSKIVWTDTHSVKINNADVDPTKMDMSLVATMRSSILLMGAILGRFGKLKTKTPGGCQIGARSMDTHFKAFEALGVKVEHDGEYYLLSKEQPADEEIIMGEFSVTGTENIILAAALNQGKVAIRIAAADPSVQDLCWFLQALGVEISGVGTHHLVINGAKTVHGCEYHIMPDNIETGTFIALAGVTRSHITITNTAPQFLTLELVKFREAGLKIDIKYLDLSPNPNYQLAEITVDGRVDLQAINKLHDMPYPGFAADLMQPFTALMTQAKGTTLIHDWMYDGRLKYVSELKKMGADIVVSDPHRIVVLGPARLFGKEMNSFDLRAGATLIIAALSAEGESSIDNIYQVDRGYESLDTRLSNLGANIKRVND